MYLFIYFTSLHFSSNPVLIIRRSNFINTSSGMISLCRWLLGMQFRRDRHTGQTPTQSDTYQMMYWYNCFSWWWALGCLKHVEKWNKQIEWKVRQVGYYQELYRDARSTKYKIILMYFRHPGRTVAQTVRHRPLAVQAWTATHASLYRMCSGQSGTGTGFAPNTAVFHCQHHSTSDRTQNYLHVALTRITSDGHWLENSFHFC
jgi:hypothetical protein